MSQDNSLVEDNRPNPQVMTNGTPNQALDDWVIEALDGLADDTNDLPISLIATNLDVRIFTDPSFKAEFESIFRQFDAGQVTFQYFKSFKRARVNFSNPQSAALARIHCHSRRFGDSLVNCYYFYNPETQFNRSGVEVEGGEEISSQCHLKPPQLQKLFLISPPASPPVGWEPREEAEPINYELIAAITRLIPGEPHELHPKSDSHPAIVVHTCDDPVDEESDFRMKTKIQQTARPVGQENK